MSDWGLIGLVGVVVGVTVVWGCFWFADTAAQNSGIADPGEQAKFKDSYTKTIAQVLGGGFVVLTLAWTINKDSESLRQSSTTSANQQFVEAAKLMSSNEVAARTAGNYAYAKLVEARPEFTQPVRHTLMAVILAQQPEDAKSRTTIEVNAALSTLGKLTLPSDDKFYLRDLCLAGGDFSASIAYRNADFQGAKLYAANFTWAQLGSALFNGALLADEAFYEGDLVAHLGDPNIATAWLAWERYRYIANFESSNLTDARFENTSVAGASFKNANLQNARFYGADVSRADFEGATNLNPNYFEGACFGKTPENRTQTQPRGLPAALIRSLGVCKPWVAVDDVKHQSTCPLVAKASQKVLTRDGAAIR